MCDGDEIDVGASLMRLDFFGFAGSCPADQTSQISPVVTGTGLDALDALDDLDQLVDGLVSRAATPSLPTTIALTLL